MLWLDFRLRIRHFGGRRIVRAPDESEHSLRRECNPRLEADLPGRIRYLCRAVPNAAAILRDVDEVGQPVAGLRDGEAACMIMPLMQ